MNSGHYNVHTPIALFSSASTYASTTPLFMTVMASSNRFSLVSSAGVLHSVFHVYISYPIPRKEIISYNLTVILQHHIFRYYFIYKRSEPCFLLSYLSIEN